MWHGLGQCWGEFDRMLADCGHLWLAVDQTLPGFCRNWGNSDRSLSMSIESGRGQDSNEFGTREGVVAIIGDFWDAVGLASTTSTRPKLAASGQGFEKV